MSAKCPSKRKAKKGSSTSGSKATNEDFISLISDMEFKLNSSSSKIVLLQKKSKLQFKTIDDILFQMDEKMNGIKEVSREAGILESSLEKKMNDSFQLMTDIRKELVGTKKKLNRAKTTINNKIAEAEMLVPKEKK